MKLEELGYTKDIQLFRAENKLTDFETARVTAEHKERYIVRNEAGEYEAEITGNMRFSANDRLDFPAVGDWVFITVFCEGTAVIQKIAPRKSKLTRRAVGKQGEIQLIAANIDYAFIIQAADRDFSLNRLERYLAIANTGNVVPIFILSKIDLIDGHRQKDILETLKSRHKDLLVIPISNETKTGLDRIKETIFKGKTYCFLGSSGVGKSTLINNLLGREVLMTKELSASTNKGRHTTSHRELFVLEEGGILLDTPGMRELGITNNNEGLEITFDEINKLAELCYFSDCTHTNEKGCAVQSAINKGELDDAAFKNFKKMEREKIHFESTVAEKRKKDKQFGKMVKEVMKHKKKNKN